MRKVCFFLGQKMAPEGLLPRLSAEIARHAEGCGVRDFVVGRYGASARLAAEAVSAAKASCPGIRLLRLCPYPRTGTAVRLPEGADGVVAPLGLGALPVPLALAYADLYMLRHSSFLIVYAPEPEPHVRQTLEYARRMQAHGLIQISELPCFRECLRGQGSEKVIRGV